MTWPILHFSQPAGTHRPFKGSLIAEIYKGGLKGIKYLYLLIIYFKYVFKNRNLRVKVGAALKDAADILNIFMRMQHVYSNGFAA